MESSRRNGGGGSRRGLARAPLFPEIKDTNFRALSRYAGPLDLVSRINTPGFVIDPRGDAPCDKRERRTLFSEFLRLYNGHPVLHGREELFSFAVCLNLL